mmetsp:Transcript_38469/g.75852  ORF Transcript_38469/g.75852 Transcript_38469/m.75852 type:complete len:357 (-) Transcript_38469:345-1415(-)
MSTALVEVVDTSMRLSSSNASTADPMPSNGGGAGRLSTKPSLGLPLPVDMPLVAVVDDEEVGTTTADSSALAASFSPPPAPDKTASELNPVCCSSSSESRLARPPLRSFAPFSPPFKSLPSPPSPSPSSSSACHAPTWTFRSSLRRTGWFRATRVATADTTPSTVCASHILSPNEALTDKMRSSKFTLPDATAFPFGSNPFTKTAFCCGTPSWALPLTLPSGDSILSSRVMPRGFRKSTVKVSLTTDRHETSSAPSNGRSKRILTSPYIRNLVATEDVTPSTVEESHIPPPHDAPVATMRSPVRTPASWAEAPGSTSHTTTQVRGLDRWASVSALLALERGSSASLIPRGLLSRAS